MPITHHVALMGKAPKSSLHIAIRKAVKIFLPHLIHDDAYHQLGLFGKLLRQDCRRTGANRKQEEKKSFHGENWIFFKDKDKPLNYDYL